MKRWDLGRRWWSHLTALSQYSTGDRNLSNKSLSARLEFGCSWVQIWDVTVKPMLTVTVKPSVCREMYSNVSKTRKIKTIKAMVPLCTNKFFFLIFFCTEATQCQPMYTQWRIYVVLPKSSRNLNAASLPLTEIFICLHPLRSSPLLH
jgi:hypothetical protein